MSKKWKAMSYQKQNGLKEKRSSMVPPMFGPAKSVEECNICNQQ